MSRFTKLFIVALLPFIFAGCSSTVLVKHSEHSDLYSPAMGRNMSYSVYTPPDWTPSESLPLMVLLHGARDNHETFDRYLVGQTLDEAINAGRAPRMIIVSPDGELGFWENWHDGSKMYRDWVVKDLMPHVTARYSSLPCPEYCYVSGISMGGHGALRFAYYEPEVFSSVAALSAPIISKLYPGKPSIGRTLLRWLIPSERIWGDIDSDSSDVPKDLDPYISWVNRPDLVRMPLLLAWGDEEGDSIAGSNAKFQAHLAAAGKPHAWMIYEGGHKWIYWRDIMSSVLVFHANANKNKKALSPPNNPTIHYVGK